MGNLFSLCCGEEETALANESFDQGPTPDGIVAVPAPVDEKSKLLVKQEVIQVVVIIVSFKRLLTRFL